MGRWKSKGGRKVGESVNIKKISKCKKKKNYIKIGKKLDIDIDTNIYIYIYIEREREREREREILKTLNN